MKVSIIGTGYVGLVTGTCFAELGNDVTCIDIDEDKIIKMRDGKIPIYEPGLIDIFKHNMEEGRLKFSTNIQDGLDAKVIFLALPTPAGEDGSADTSYILGVAKELGKILKKYTVIVNKSTVPVGTAKLVYAEISKNSDVEFDVVSNPEFLREGQAVDDFLNPERIVVGSNSIRATRIMKELYKPFINKDPNLLIVSNCESAEMIKYAANAFLATKISFINQISGLCELVGADVDKVRIGIGSDSRIGHQFMSVGPGYGGSCFPKDVLAINKIAKDKKYKLGLLDAVIEANEQQKLVLPAKINKYFSGNIEGKTIALWGLAFKDNTDDIRESPAIVILKELLRLGANVVAYDPQAINNTKKVLEHKNLAYADNEYGALEKTDALVIATNWKEFSSPDFEKMKKLLKKPVIFDGRNLYDPDEMEDLGFHYESIGRRVVN